MPVEAALRPESLPEFPLIISRALVGKGVEGVDPGGTIEFGREVCPYAVVLTLYVYATLPYGK